MASLYSSSSQTLGKKNIYFLSIANCPLFDGSWHGPACLAVRSHAADLDLVQHVVAGLVWWGLAWQ